MENRNPSWQNRRFIAWHRARSQARFRGEEWNLSYSEFCEFWPDEETFARRGRGARCLSLTRYDPELPWDRHNVAQVQGSQMFLIRNARRYGTDYRPHFRYATWLTSFKEKA